MTSPELQNEVEAASSIFEQIALESDAQVERSAIRRAVEESADAWPGEATELWWRWILEASESLGIKSRVVDCTFDQAVSIVQDGGHVVVRLQSTSDWVAATSGGGRKILSYRPGERQLPMSVRKYEKLFGGEEKELRMVVMEPSSVSLSHSELNPVRKPLDRLRTLLRPESSDIWILLVFALVNGILMMATPLAIESLVTTVAFGRTLQPVIILAIVLFGFLAFSAAIRALQTVVVEIIQRRLFARVVADIAYRFPRVKYESLEGQYTPELVNRFFDVVTVQKVTASMLLDGFTLVLSTIIGMAVLAFYHPWLLGFDIVLLSMIAFAVIVLGRGAITTSIKESKMKYKTASFLEDLAFCLITFKSGGASEYAMERADHLTYEYLSARRKHFQILISQVIFVLSLQAFASTALLGLGGWLVISGELTLGQLVAAELIVTIIVGSFAKLGKHMESFYDLLASVDKLGVLFDLPMESSEGILKVSNELAAELVIRGVTYSSPTGMSVVETVDQRISPGSRCLIDGPTGSGKSALIDMIYRLRKPSNGHLILNGTDIRDMRPNVLRRQVALLRGMEIFEGTIAENVHLERAEISKSQVSSSLEAVGILDEILELPDGIKTHVTTGGYPLSRAQVCKIMLARAIAGRPTLILIDALLDFLPDDEADQLMKSICAPERPWTVIIVTGRTVLKKHATMQFQMSRTRLAPRDNTGGTHAY